LLLEAHGHSLFGFRGGNPSFQPKAFEFDAQALVVDLQTDGSLIQSSALRVVGELGSEFAVDEELEVISAGNDADVVPLVWADVCRGECPADGAGMRRAVLVDDQPCPAVAGIFLALREVEIPRTENVGTDTDVAEVGVIALERPLAAPVGLTADFDSRVAFARQAITQFEFEVRKMLILPDEIGEPVGAPVPDNHSIANRPVPRTLFRHRVPAVQRPAVENGDEAVAGGLSEAS